MKLSLSIFLMFSLLYCSSQSNISKYSYIIYGRKINIFNDGIMTDTYSATCFFVKIESKTFLVSAKHVLTKCLGEKTKEDFPDTMFVWLTKKGSPLFEEVAFPLKKINDTVHCVSTSVEPDVYLCEFKNANKYEIHSIEKMIKDPLLINKKEAVIFSSGFPGDKRVSFNNKKYSHPLNCTFSMLSGLEEKLIVDPNANPKVIDSQNYLVEVLSGNLKEGFSGSPVFFVGKDSTFTFGGIISVANDNNSVVKIVKPHQVVERIAAAFRAWY